MNGLLKRDHTISEAAIQIGEAALFGMLCEISAAPSPGLVSPFSQGAHTDMDYYTFLRSTSAIAGTMSLCAQIGIDNEKGHISKLREAGIEAEKKMFAATHGVNTQKGVIFLGGITCCAAGCSIREGKAADRHNISKFCSSICEGIVEKELGSIDRHKKMTNGERIYSELGITGIRGEAEKGLPTVMDYGLPYYEDAIKEGLGINDSLVHALIAIMSVVYDTAVINRCGMEGIHIMHNEAKRALDLGGMKSREGRDCIVRMDKLFKEANISPGGAADLLAVTAMIHEMEKIN